MISFQNNPLLHLFENEYPEKGLNMAGYYELSDLPVFSAEASVSAADADYDGVKSYDAFRINNLQKLITAVTLGFSLASIFASFLAFGLMGTTLLAYGAFGIPMVLAPVVIFQRLKIHWGASFRQIHNKLRMKANEFAYENFRLQTENGRLEIEVKGYVGIKTIDLNCQEDTL